MWPEVVTTFEQFLQRQGLEFQGRREDPAAFGNKLLEYANRDIRVQVVCDRSVWSVMISDPVVRPEYWYDVHIIRDLLLGPRDDTLPLNQQIEFLESSWWVIMSRFDAQQREGTKQQLKLLQKKRAKQRWPNWSRQI